MRAPGLTGWLAIVTVLLVTLAVTAVSIAAIGSLRGLAVAEALIRVELAVSTAREGLRQSTEDLLTAARVLGERPTLQRLLSGASIEAVTPYLSRYCEGGALDGCAIVRGGGILTATRDDLDWHGIAAGALEQGERYLVAGSKGGPPLAGASAEVADNPRTRVLVVRRIDEAFARRLSERAGLEIRILDYGAGPDRTDQLRDLDAAAIARRAPATGYVEPLDAYAASLPVTAATGETVALLRAVLPAVATTEPLTKTTRRMLAIAIAVAAIAAFSGVLIGRHWIGGVGRLTAAARRIGAGDLSASIPRERGKELGILAGTMEEMRRSLVELESARRTRDTVLANISHEFRTPLAAQLASIELLHDGLGEMTLDQQRELVESLERGAQKLTRLIDNLLESVRIESGQLAIRRQRVQMTDVVAAARDLVEPLIHQRGQRLETRLDNDLPSIEGDRQRLVQVLVNLLANASKFGPPGSVIRIDAQLRPVGGVTFWVEDEGPGPADPGDAVLFEQFRRSSGDDPDESGLGLGLFIVRSIVERHGGRVSLTRTQESRTRAVIELPGGCSE